MKLQFLQYGEMHLQAVVYHKQKTNLYLHVDCFTVVGNLP